MSDDEDIKSKSRKGSGETAQEMKARNRMGDPRGHRAWQLSDGFQAENIVFLATWFAGPGVCRLMLFSCLVDLFDYGYS